MKVGRNDPCPCGSGKKFKKCCMGKTVVGGSPPPGGSGFSKRSSPLPPPRSATPHPPALAPPRPKPPEQPPDPDREKWDAFWKEFESQDAPGRANFFLKTLEDKELIDDETAFEMLNQLHHDLAQRGERSRFAELVNALHDRYPEVYQEGAHYYLDWRLEDDLVEGQADVLPLVRELAARAGQDIDIVTRGLRALAYHGRLPELVEAMRIGWPGVRSSSNVVPWGVSRFAEEGTNYEIYDYLEHTTSPNPDDAALLDRVKFFIPDPYLDNLTQFIRDLTAQDVPAWTVDDFALKPPRRKRRDPWGDEDDEEDEAPDPGALHLSRLITQFVGYLRREEGVPFCKAELVREEFFRYFVRRHQGDLDPQPSMLEQAMNPKKKLPPPPKPGHPLCPERVTLDTHLTGLVGFLNGMYHTATALFELMPGWLRFLESRSLIDADRREKTIQELRPLHADLLRVLEKRSEEHTS